MCNKIPQNVTYDQAATLPVPFNTASTALFHKLKLPQTKTFEGEPPTVLVWSGASAVGFYTVQLAHLYGFKVVTTASPQHHDLLKSLGADHVFDYRDAEVVQKIKSVANVTHAVDAISEDATLQQVVDAFGKDGGTVCLVLSPKKPTNRSDVKFVNVLLYTAAGRPINVFGMSLPAIPEDRAFHEGFQNVLNQLLIDGKLKFLNTEDRGGLENVDAAYDDMAAGKNRGTKYVFHP